MFDDLPPDLERLHTLRVWHAMWLARIDRKIAQVTRRQAEEEHGRRTKPAVPEWIVELGIGAGRPPAQLHRGNCYMAGKRRRTVSREEARRLLADGTTACTHCRPDTGLGIIGLTRPQHHAGRHAHSRDGIRAAISLAQRPATAASGPLPAAACRSQSSRSCASASVSSGSRSPVPSTGANSIPSRSTSSKPSTPVQRPVLRSGHPPAHAGPRHMPVQSRPKRSLHRLGFSVHRAHRSGMSCRFHISGGTL